MAKKNGPSVMVCPNCASVNVHSDLSKDMIGWGGVTRYVCDDCSHSAITFPLINSSDLGYYKKKLKKTRRTEGKIEPKTNLKVGTPNTLSSRIFLLCNLFILVLVSLAGYSLEGAVGLFFGLGWLVPILTIIWIARRLKKK